MSIVNIWKPWYVYRPSQILRRISYSFKTPNEDAVFELPWGARLYANPRKTIGQSIAQTGIYDLATSELLYRLTQPGDQVLDVGANIGYMTTLLAHRVGLKGKVIAFEPHPDLYRQLRKNVKSLCMKNSVSNIELYCCAVTGVSGKVTLLCPEEFDRNDGVSRIDTTKTDAPRSFSVDALALDELLSDRGPFSLMKIDIEGHELQAFQGATNLLSDSITHVVFEDHQGPQSAACQYLCDLGFDVLQFGWSMRGLCLADAGVGKLSHSYEAPNYIATRNRGYVFDHCRTRGWQVLRS